MKKCLKLLTLVKTLNMLYLLLFCSCGSVFLVHVQYFPLDTFRVLTMCVFLTTTGWEKTSLVLRMA